MIPEAAVEAAFREVVERSSKPGSWTLEDTLRAALEAAYPILLSHERQQTADAHRDAMVNRDTANRLQEQIDALPHMLERAFDDGFTTCANEHTKQWNDPAYPITRVNPYRK